MIATVRFKLRLKEAPASGGDSYVEIEAGVQI